MKLPAPPSLHDRSTPTRLGCGGTLATTLTSLAVFLLFMLPLPLPAAPALALAGASASAGAGAAADRLTAKRLPEPRCFASHTSESSDLPITRSKSKARENAKVSGSRREGEGSRSVVEEAVTCFLLCVWGGGVEEERKKRRER